MDAAWHTILGLLNTSFASDLATGEESIPKHFRLSPILEFNSNNR